MATPLRQGQRIACFRNGEFLSEALHDTRFHDRAREHDSYAQYLRFMQPFLDNGGILFIYWGDRHVKQTSVRQVVERNGAEGRIVYDTGRSLYRIEYEGIDLEKALAYGAGAGPLRFPRK